VFGKRTDVLKTNHMPPSAAGQQGCRRGDGAPERPFDALNGAVIESGEAAFGRGGVTMRIGVKVPNSGPLPERLGIGAMAAELEAAGFESLWVSDHIVLPSTIGSWYPFADDGRATWATDTPYFDALIALALIAQATERATIGTAVLVLPLRQPVVFAKQAASIDVASGGRLRLGVGAGWLEEEFDALNVPFERRGRRLEEWVALVRACWTGRPAPSSSDLYRLPPDVLCLPRPAHDVPLLVGGHSRTALRRAGRIGNGWLAQQALPALAPDELAREIEVVRAAASEAGRDPGSLDVVLRVVEAAGRSDEVAARLPELAAAGVDEIVVDVPLENGEAAVVHATLAQAAAKL
jgi:probable F420-dependent oxidoreductase